MIVEENKKITVTIDGVEHEAQPGQMLIELTDKTGTYVPRFCYHEKLSIAANCSCLLYTSPSPRDQRGSRVPSSA